jgi:hypothetical protein
LVIFINFLCHGRHGLKSVLKSFFLLLEIEVVALFVLVFGTQLGLVLGEVFVKHDPNFSTIVLEFVCGILLHLSYICEQFIHFGMNVFDLFLSFWLSLLFLVGRCCSLLIKT